MMFFVIFAILFIFTLLLSRFYHKLTWKISFGLTWIYSAVMTAMGYAGHFASNLTPHC